jgi:hypothetical protein
MGDALESPAATRHTNTNTSNWDLKPVVVGGGWWVVVVAHRGAWRKRKRKPCALRFGVDVDVDVPHASHKSPTHIPHTTT